MKRCLLFLAAVVAQTTRTSLTCREKIDRLVEIDFESMGAGDLHFMRYRVLPEIELECVLLSETLELERVEWRIRLSLDEQDFDEKWFSFDDYDDEWDL